MLTLASPSVRASSPSVPGRSWMSTTSTSRSSATPISASSTARRAAVACASSTRTWMIPRPSPANAHIPWMFTPTEPVAWPSRASSPGRSWRTTVRSLGISPPLGGISAGARVRRGRREAGASLGLMANRLAAETSPYLLQHRDNPVDWYPWGAEALERAKAEDRPSLLSIGYAACHWCHVMERESFEDPDTAAYMNEHFVCIKVDREERPDIDSIYMEATQAMTGHGGWPMTVFLTPQGEPFYAGTYFPPEDRHG